VRNIEQLLNRGEGTRPATDPRKAGKRNDGVDQRRLQVNDGGVEEKKKATCCSGSGWGEKAPQNRMLVKLVRKRKWGQKRDLGGVRNRD